jgi:hypothetical protein
VSRFRSKLIVEDPGGFPYILYRPLTYESDILGRSISVPCGFKTDFASIPLGLHNILAKSGKYDAAAVVHDYLYQFNGCTRLEADRVLLEAMTVCGVGSVKRRIIYWGVRVGGWKPWNEYREATGT